MKSPRKPAELPMLPCDSPTIIANTIGRFLIIIVGTAILITLCILHAPLMIAERNASMIVPRFLHHYTRENGRSALNSTQPVVNTQFGPVYGVFGSDQFELKWSGDSNDAPQCFLGIPFAKPPIGQLRFQSPIEWNTSWMDSYGFTDLRATRFSPQCIQLSDVRVMSEDCLYLNVYTPSRHRMQELAAQGRHKLPVMFWLFGGAYIFGSAGTGTLSDPNLYVGTSVVHQKDVIVVTANARVGVFGFLLTGNLTGNYGIDDHLMAIRWTFRNIGRFGGDPEQITVFGCSSGAFSSGLIAMHPEAPPIQRVIMMSPPSALHLTSRQQAMADGKVFTAAAGCNDGSRSVENCLRQASATRLYLADSMTARNGYSYRIIDRPLKWMPVDGGRYRDISTQLLRERKRKRRQIDWMIGVTAHEMTFFLFGMETFNLLRGSTFYYLRGNQSAVEFWLSWLMGEHWAVEKYQPYRDILSLQRPLSHADRQFIRLVERFFGNGNNREHLMRLLAAYPPRYSTSENINQLQDLLTDYLFICSNQKLLSVLASQSAKVYSYYYSQDSDWAWPLFGRGTLMEGRSALHALDMPLFWNYYPRIPSSMRGISNLFVDYFTSFAYGNIQDARHPRSLYQQEGLAHLPNWPVFNDTERMYLDLGSPSNQATVRSHLRQQYCNILNHFY